MSDTTARHPPVKAYGNAIDAAMGLFQHLGLSLQPDTAARMVKALEEMTAGADVLHNALVKGIKTFDAPPDPGIVVVKDIPFSSLCEHHMLPFQGMVSVAYLPDELIVGLSKIPRLVKLVAARPQVQERLGQMVADALAEAIETPGRPPWLTGVVVVVRGQHTCMSHRGARSPGTMVTSCVRGVFRQDASARAEALGLLGS
jgi:GTP cyclohydrolase I